MKKLLFVLLLSFACSGIYAQVKANGPGPYYGNGDSYGFYVDEVPGAVSYEWSVYGGTGAVIWPADWTDTAIDLTFSYAGICEITCTITLANNTQLVYTLSVDVYEE